MLEVFLDALVLKVVEEGMRADSGFKREAWTYALEQVLKINSSVTLDHCKSKITTCKEDWKLWSGLTRLSGFSATEHGVVVADNKVLQEYFDAHPKAKKFKSRPLEFEEQHRQLFEGVLATGQDALLIDDAVADDFEPAQSIERDPSVDTSQATEEDGDVEQKLSRKRAGSRSVGRALEKRGRKQTGLDRLQLEIGLMRAEIGRLADSAQRDDQREAIAEFMRTYQALDDRLKFAMLSVFERPIAAKTFLSLWPRSTQKGWVKRELEKMYDQQVFDNFAEVVESMEWEGDGELKLKSQC